jgi:chromosome partitioning protein
MQLERALSRHYRRDTHPLTYSEKAPFHRSIRFALYSFEADRNAASVFASTQRFARTDRIKMAAHVIAVANRKGGVGKTTTAVNVAAELAERGRRILLVDLDPQGHAGLGLGVAAAKGEPAVHQLFRRDPIQLANAVKVSNCVGLDVLPAERDFQVHEATNEPLRLAAALLSFNDIYDDIIIDTPPTVDVTLLSALAAAHHVLIPMQLQHLAYDGIVRFSQVLFKVATALNRRFTGLAIVPIQIDVRITMQRVILAKLIKDFSDKRIFHGIRTDVALAEAFGSNTAVRHYRPQSRAATDYALLTDDILSFWQNPRADNRATPSEFVRVAC